jgi:stage V sporulation protein G
VTEVRIQLTREPPILAFVAVTLWDTLVVHDLRILQRRDGSTVVLMPRIKGPDGNWSTVAHPVNEETRCRIEQCVMQAFEMEVRKAAQASA